MHKQYKGQHIFAILLSARTFGYYFECTVILCPFWSRNSIASLWWNPRHQMLFLGFFLPFHFHWAFLIRKGKVEVKSFFFLPTFHRHIFSKIVNCQWISCLNSMLFLFKANKPLFIFIMHTWQGSVAGVLRKTWVSIGLATLWFSLVS